MGDVIEKRVGTIIIEFHTCTEKYGSPFHLIRIRPGQYDVKCEKCFERFGLVITKTINSLDRGQAKNH